MISLNGTIPVVATSNIINTFASKGKNIDLLSMCNMQDFKYIDGCGEGYFLMEYGALGTDNTCVLTLSKAGSPVSRALLITDSYILQSSAAPTLQLIKTAELKYSLESITVPRNYNVVDVKTITGSTGATLAPDTTSKTITQIIAEIDPTLLIVWNANNFKPYNMFVDGLSLREMLDRVCMAYGLLWTVEYSNTIEEDVVKTLYVYPGTDLTPTYAFPSDVNQPYPLQQYKEITTIYSILNNGLQTPKNYEVKSSLAGGNKTYDVYNPYFPALLQPGLTTLANNTALANIHNYIQPNIAAIIKHENYYYVQNYIETDYLPSIAPKALKYTYGHNGQGLRTCLFSGVYPTLPVPEHNRSDRQATQVVGRLTYEYKGASILGFYVTAEYGLDGFIANNTVLYVTNLYNWNYGALNAKVRIEWDAINRRWIPLQQAYVCPPTTTPPDLPAPPTAPTYPEIGFGV